MSETAITIAGGELPAQTDPDAPRQVVIADLSGYREPPGEDDEAGEDPHRFDAVEVTPDSYDAALLRWQPRFRATLPSRLSGREAETLTVDVTFTRTTPFWPGELDRIPELQAVRQKIRQLERLQQRLAQQPGVRQKLESLLQAALPEN